MLSFYAIWLAELLSEYQLICGHLVGSEKSL